jgi:hypothetical protein
LVFDDDSAGVTTQAKYDTDTRAEQRSDGRNMQAKGDIVQKTSDFANGEVSFWFRDIGLPPRRAPLTGPIDVDVAIVGAGLTGLWTAYYLATAVPELSVAIVEKEFAGFGASGRNGGWLSGEPAGQSGDTPKPMVHTEPKSCSSICFRQSTKSSRWGRMKASRPISSKTVSSM